MDTTKSQQMTGLILGIISVALPIVAGIIDNASSIGVVVVVIIMCLAALVLGIIGIVKSAGAMKAAGAAGENKVVSIIGLIISIIGTVYSAIDFFAVGICVACVLCAAGSIASQLG